MGISIGVVGCGRFAPGFIRLFRDHPMVDRVALCDIKPERVKENLEKFNLTEGYASLDEVCKNDIDGIDSFTEPPEGNMSVTNARQVPLAAPEPALVSNAQASIGGEHHQNRQPSRPKKVLPYD